MVSVIIPNYNHASYLPKRIQSVLNQTYTDIEVILLDDCSTDNSAEIIRDFAAMDNRIQVVLNVVNSGSTFKQWNKGFELAKGTFIWIAESDDYAAPTFLERIMAIMLNYSDVGLAYTGSYSIDSHNNVLSPPESIYQGVDDKFWKNDFIAQGLDIVRKFMTFSPVIPNASAAVFRKDLLDTCGKANENFKLAADWLFWARLMATTKLAYISDGLNFFRTHDQNVRTKSNKLGVGLEEGALVFLEISRYEKIDTYFFEKKMSSFLSSWFYGMVNFPMSINMHIRIYKTLKKIEPAFEKRFRKAFIKFLFLNKCSGIKQFIGDRWLRRLYKSI